MRLKISIIMVVFATTFLLAMACSREPGNPGLDTSKNIAKEPTVALMKEARALPVAAFKAQLTLIDPPTKMRTGEKQTILVKVKNASDQLWFARGGEVNKNPDNRFFLAVGNRWLKSDEKNLVTNMDGRYGLQKDLKPAEEEQVSLQITAPKDPGEYTLEVDLLQEQVAWFSDKGSPTARAKITVVK